jgi:DtxR family Mn-dependent transcriptional regulator
MSEQVERRLLEILQHPNESPYGNPIPGLDELGDPAPEGGPADAFLDGVRPLAEAVTSEPSRRIVRRIAEELQKDAQVLSVLRRVGALPGNDILVSQGHEGILIARQGETAEVDAEAANHIFVSA